MSSSDRPAEVCPKCFAPLLGSPISWRYFECGAFIGPTTGELVRSDGCRYRVAQAENARLTAALQASQGKLEAIEAALPLLDKFQATASQPMPMEFHKQDIKQVLLSILRPTHGP